MGARSDQPSHECRQHRRCKARIRDAEGEWHGAGVEEAGRLCRPCEEHAFDAISLLAEDWDALVLALTDPLLSAEQDQNVTTSAGHPIPLRVDVDALMVAMETELIRWADRLQEEDLPRNSGECVKRCLTILGSHKGTLIDLPAHVYEDWTREGDDLIKVSLDGVDAVLRLAAFHYQAMAVLGLSETRIWLPDPCPSCGRKSLSPSANQERISCQGCHAVWDSQHFALLGNVLDFERRAVKGAA